MGSNLQPPGIGRHPNFRHRKATAAIATGWGRVSIGFNAEGRSMDQHTKAQQSPVQPSAGTDEVACISICSGSAMIMSAAAEPMLVAGQLVVFSIAVFFITLAVLVHNL